MYLLWDPDLRRVGLFKVHTVGQGRRNKALRKKSFKYVGGVGRRMIVDRRRGGSEGMVRLVQR